MARLAGRTAAAPPKDMKKALIADEEQVTGKISKSSSIESASSITSTASSGGRAGMVRKTLSVQSPTSNTHASALGRGHNEYTLVAQNYHPFLDKSYFRRRRPEEGLSTMKKSVTNSNFPVGPNGEVIYTLLIEVINDSSDEGNPIFQTMLDFESGASINSVMVDIFSHIDVDKLKPTHIFCRNLNKKLEEGTLESNGVLNDFTIELHVQKLSSSVHDNLSELAGNQPSSETFVSKFQPNSLYLAYLYFDTRNSILLNRNGMLPAIQIINNAEALEDFGPQSKDFAWIRARSVDWEVSFMEAINAGLDEKQVFSPDALQRKYSAIHALANRLANGSSEKGLSFQLKGSFLNAVIQFQKEFKLTKFGNLYHEPIAVSSVKNTKMIVCTQFCSSAIDPEILKVHGLRWKSALHLNQTYFSLKDTHLWALYLQYYKNQMYTLQGGIYVGIFRVRTTMNNIDIMVNRHHPDLIPIRRLRTSTGSSLGSTTASRLDSVLEDTEVTATSGAVSNFFSATTSMTDGNSSRSVKLLSENEIQYLRYVAELDRTGKATMPPGITVDRPLEGLGLNMMKAMKHLAEETGSQNLEFSPVNPIIIRDDIMILVFDCIDDLKLQADVPKATGLLAKLGLKKAKTSEASQTSGSSSPQYNKTHFQFLPVNLYEIVYHSRYNPSNYAMYRQAVERLQTEINECEILHPSQPVPPALLSDLQEKRKKWNSQDSWVMRIFTHNREKALKSATV